MTTGLLPYPDPEDLATIRYTSGTTGEPKGVTFTFRQLAWMGEVLTNLVSFRDRNRPMRYLSFLPLSHVVEGILSSYAPHCPTAIATLLWPFRIFCDMINLLKKTAGC